VGSNKQKLNTRSSTESEIVGVDDFMPAICWTRYFLEAQGYNVQDNVLFQDNKSSILLEKNGKASSSKRTKHINVRYFFITDRANKGEVSIVWCPTGDMILDYATKPLQGALFRKFRDQIMGVVPAQDPGSGKTDRNIGKSDTVWSRQVKSGTTGVCWEMSIVLRRYDQTRSIVLGRHDQMRSAQGMRSQTRSIEYRLVLERARARARMTGSRRFECQASFSVRALMVSTSSPHY
jgi:hypothetical protein